MDDPDPGGTFSILSAAALPELLQAEPVSSDGILLKLAILFFLILINAFFAMSEIAIVSLNDAKLEKLASQGHKKSMQILALTQNSAVFLSTIQIGVTLAGFLTSSSAAQSFAPMLVSLIDPYLPDAVPRGLLLGVSTVIITLITSYFSLVLGELVPKKIALQKPEQVSYFAIGLLTFVSKVFKPFVKILVLSTNGIVRLFGIDPNANEDTANEEEIRMMVDQGEKKGFIENTQREMIINVFEFDDIDAGDIMTHRVDMVAVEADEPIDEVIKAAIEEGYSRIPVYDEEPDNIIGIVYVKDLLQYVGTEIPKTKTIREIMREAYLIPESKKCGELFTEMTEKRVQMAIVVDEYGGTAGLVTMEDLLEAIVGNIRDEYDTEEEEDINKINDTTFTIDGITDIDELGELTGTHLPEGDYDTVGGFIISRLGYLPADGDMDVTEYKNLRFTVLSVEDNKRIDKVKVEILPEPVTDENGDKLTETAEIKENGKKKKKQ
ncbi:MAG TPA: hemolysin family protein [Clostridiales bacterium]|nr:hemolysin family protein [Clostridiales bacterium]